MNSLTGGLQILAGIEVVRMLREVLTDDSGHRKADIGVDVDLADSAAGSLAELILRDADGAGHISAVLVDLRNEFLRNGGRTVQNDREAGQLLGAIFEHVKPELGLGAGLELVSAVAGADCDRQGVAAGTGCKFDNFFRMSVHGFVCFDGNFVFHAGKSAEFGLDHNTVIMRILDHLTGEGDILFEGLGGSIDHNGGETAVDAALAQFKGITVIQVQGDRDFGIQLDCGLDQLDQVCMVGVSAGTLGNLQNDGSFELAGSIGNSLNDFHVVDVEGADSVSAVIGFLKHFGCCNQWHGTDLL